MPLPKSIESHRFDRRVVSAWYHGQLPELLRQLHTAGHAEIRLADLEARAELMAETWLINEPDKESCYLCGRPHHGELCPCFDEVTPGRYANVHAPKQLAALHPHTVVEVIVCKTCAECAEVNAESVLAAHKRHGSYKGRQQCKRCYKNSKQRPRKLKAPEDASIEKSIINTLEEI